MGDVSASLPQFPAVNLDIDTSEECLAEAAILHVAWRILGARWPHSNRYGEAAPMVREAERDLISRSRHPSRQPQGPVGLAPEQDQAWRDMVALGEELQGPGDGSLPQ